MGKSIPHRCRTCGRMKLTHSSWLQGNLQCNDCRNARKRLQTRWDTYGREWRMQALSMSGYLYSGGIDPEPLLTTPFNALPDNTRRWLENYYR